MTLVCDLLGKLVTCRIGSLEIIVRLVKKFTFVTCRIGSLEKRRMAADGFADVTCRIGSLEMNQLYHMPSI